MHDDDRPLGLARKLTSYGDVDFALFLRRSFARSMGLSLDALTRPVVGIAVTPSGFNNCHRTMDDLVEAVSRGILMAGALPLPFPTISLGEPFLSPTSMMFRNLMAMDTEEMISAQPMDSVVLIGGCDKTVPAQLMAAASANVPAIQLVTGPMLTGQHMGQRLGACTDCRAFWAKYRASTLTGDELTAVEARLAVTAGTCAVMGTASTMACVAETLGMSLPGTAAIPAVNSARLAAAEETGKAAVRLITMRLEPREIMSAHAIENALRVVMALGGSTNAVIHLAAIAGRLGHTITMAHINQISDQTPVLVDMKPVGHGYMEDFYAAGGLGAVLRELRPMLHLDTTDVEGRTLAERLDAPSGYVDRAVIHEARHPISPVGGIVALSGTLAPDGALLKRAAASPELFETRGRAVVFNGLDDLHERIDSPGLDVCAADILVLKNAGPRGAGMPESGFLPIPMKLARAGVKDMLRISDARMSGTAYGTVVLHVAPEAAVGGPLALAETGDTIELSVSQRRLDLVVPEHELANRRTALRLPDAPSRGYKALYWRSVLQAPEGCDFDFLRASCEKSS